MATDDRTIRHLVDLLADAEVTAKRMFGEYGLYCDGRMVALVCDDRLFVKPTDGGRAYAPDLSDGTPYPGAKPSMLVDERYWEDPDRLVELIRITARELPVPKPRSRGGKARG